jgi:hypothetical protein
MYYNVTLGRFRATFVAVKKDKYYIFWVCVCRFSYRTCRTHSRLYWNFSHFLINGMGFEKFIEHKMFVLIVYITSVWNIYRSKKKWARRDEICMLVFRWSTRYSCQILMKPEFCWQIFEKYSDFLEIFQAGPECSMWTDRRTDKHE